MINNQITVIIVYKNEDDGTINPLEYENVKLMSYGYVAPRDKVTGERCKCAIVFCLSLLSVLRLN